MVWICAQVQLYSKWTKAWKGSITKMNFREATISFFREQSQKKDVF